jgi:predicted MFS family arabinose efflux permease
MLAFGAALGGFVAGGWGIYPAFFIDALTFVLSAVLISRVIYVSGEVLAESDRTLSAALRQYVEGLRYLGGHKDILVIALHKGAFALLASGPLQVIQVVLAEEIFVRGEGGGTSLGLMYAFTGVGTGLGPILARRFTGDRDRPLRVAIALSYVTAAVGQAMIATLSSFGIVLLGTTLRGVGGGIGWVFATQLLLQLVPNRVRGRVFSTEFAFFTLMNAVGTAVGGWALDAPTIGISSILWWTAVLTLIPAALWTLWIVSIQTTDQVEMEPGS